MVNEVMDMNHVVRYKSWIERECLEPSIESWNLLMSLHIDKHCELRYQPCS